jgi:small GTP-binding protein
MKFFGSLKQQKISTISVNIFNNSMNQILNKNKTFRFEKNSFQKEISTNFLTITKLNINSKIFSPNKFDKIKNNYKFCDTISNTDDIEKLINLISRETIDSIPQANIRNFCIIAHIDHGKSTLSDRLLEKSGAIIKLEKKNEQFLDTLKVERDRGITVKAQTATMIYTHKSGKYILNLIDTPGHVDFSYEVARSLRPCQGALLLIDASKGVQAQTLSNYSQAKNLGLKICPIINKIDLPTANIENTLEQIEKSMEFDKKKILKISAKTGINLDNVFDVIINDIPPPSGSHEKPMR